MATLTGWLKRKLKANVLLGLSENDVLIASFPKTGSTFTRFVLANVVNQQDGNFDLVDFYSLGKILPECHKDDLQTFHRGGRDLPRFVKTHDLRSSNVLYSLPKVIYVMRDPRDTMISYFNYSSRRKKNRFCGDFLTFVHDETFGMPAYNRHVSEWFDKAGWIFKYDDLMLRPQAVFEQFFRDISISGISSEQLGLAISNSMPEKLKRVEEVASRPGHEENFDSEFKFVRNASVNQWITELPMAEADQVWELSSSTLKAVFEENKRG